MDKKHAIFLYLLFLLIGVGTARADVATARNAWNVTTAAKIAAETQSRAKILDLKSPKFKSGVITSSSELQVSSARYFAKTRSMRAASLASFEGARTVISHRSSGLLLTSSATVSKIAADSVAIKGFIFSDVTVKAKLDPATGAVSVPSQKITTLEQGDVYLCKVDQQKGVYSKTDAVEGVASNGDLHINDAFGFFITEGSYAGSYLTAGIQTYADVATQNSTITNKTISFMNNSMTTSNRVVSEESSWAYVYQLSEDRVRISNISTKSGYTDLEATLNADGTLSIDPQPMYAVSYYGDFCCYAMTEKVSGTSIQISAQLLSPINATYDSSSKTINIGKWMTASTSVGAFGDLFESSSIATTATLTPPAKATLSLEGEGTEASPYLVKTADDLAIIAALSTDASFRGAAATDSNGDSYYPVFAGKYFALASDIDFAAIKKTFKPIGSTTYRFAGTFDGASHTISNFTITNYAYDYAGLFGCISDEGVVKNIKFTSPYVSSLGYSVAVVAGKNFGLVDSCEVSGGKVYATVGYNAGGIVGYNYGTVSNSKFTDGGYIISLGYIGGIVGRSYGPIKNCSAAARLAMTGKQVFVGGIVGYVTKKNPDGVKIELSDCDYVGTITSAGNETSLGGIAGMIANTEMTRCYATPYIYSGSTVATSLGGLVGSLWQSNIVNCYAAGIINDAENTRCGGLIGHNSEISSSTGSTIKDCYSSATVLTSNTGKLYGIIGEDALGHTTITNCYYDKQLNPAVNETMAKTTAELTKAEGISGFDASVWQYEAGLYPRLKVHADKPSAQLSAAAISFQNDENWQMVKSDFKYSVANDVEWKGVVDSKYNTTGGYAYTFKDGVAKLNYKQYTDTIYAFKGALSKVFFANIAPMSLKGEGTAESPWEIGTKDELKMFSGLTNNASLPFDGSYFKLVADIDCEGDTIVPVCKDASAKFAFLGTFDGAGHTISNMVVSSVVFYEAGNSSNKPVGEVNPRDDRSYSYAGLFANVGKTGVVKNLTIAANCKYDMFAYGGAIAGGCEGLIENCRNFAPVTVYFQKAGGIVGDLKKGGVVRNCYNNGYVRSDYGNAGGIVGTATSATIENCVNTGKAEAVWFNSYQKEGNQVKAGGIVGDMTSTTIKNVLNTGSVKSYKQVGGIAGYAKGTAAAPAIIKGAVNYGYVSSMNDASTVGLVVGDNALVTADSTYYCKSLLKIGAVNNGNLKGVEGLTSSALATDTVALDKEVWTLAKGAYPVLTFAKDEAQSKIDSKAVVELAANNFTSYISKEATLGNVADVKWSLKKGEAFAINASKLNVKIPASGIAADTLVADGFGAQRLIPIASLNVNVLSGEGTAASPYLINNADDMLTLSSFIENSGFDYDGFFFKVTSDLNFADKSYVPVSYGSNMFRGTFDGNGKTISNIVTTAPSSDRTITARGLFGTIGAGGVVKNVKLDNTNKFEAYTHSGAIAALLYGTVENCQTAASVKSTGGNYAGSIAAFAYPSSKIAKCVNEGDVYAAGSYAGGILGAAPAGASVDIEDCSNSGSVTCKTSYAGGIVGSASANISKAVNSGFVQAPTKYAAGIIAEALAYTSVKDSHNEGVANSEQYTAGIVATSALHSNANPLVIDNCYNSGDILPSVSAKASAYSYAAGIAGSLKAGFRISNCYNTAEVKPTLVKSAYMAGILADGAGSAVAKSVITHCYNTGDITIDRYGGGIAGRFSGDENSLIEFCYNTGNITASNTASSYIGGMVGNGGYYLTDSYNAGDIKGVAGYVAGLSGYLTGKAYKYERNFNIGNVTATSSTKGTQVGGLIGMGRPTMLDCANYGAVSGSSLVGGLVGTPGNAAAETYYVKLNRSYNAGKISATGSYGNITAENTSCKYLFVDSCFFDTSVNAPSAYDKALSDKGVIGLSHAELVNAKLGGAFVNSEATYPLISTFGDNEALSFGAATILLNEKERTDSVASNFLVGTPYGAVWTASSNLQIDGNTVILKNTQKEEDATLTLTVGKYTRTYNLKINHDLTGVGGIGNDGREVASVKYYTTSGVEIAEPSAEMGVIIEKVVYTDGTSAIRKYVPKN